MMINIGLAGEELSDAAGGICVTGLVMRAFELCLKGLIEDHRIVRDGFRDLEPRVNNGI